MEGLALGGAGAGHAPDGRAGHFVVAHKTGNLFGHVAVPLHIPAAGRDDNIVAVHPEAQRQQDIYHLRFVQLRAQQAVHRIHAQGDAAFFALVHPDVHHAVHHVARVQKLHQLQRTVQAAAAAVGVQPFFIAAAGLGAHAQLFGRGAHGGAVEHGAFEHDGGGVVIHAGKLAAHDTRHGDWAFFVGDDEHFLAQRAVCAVQRFNFLAGLRVAHGNVPAVYIFIVEAVHGLAVFQHDIVGDVHQVVDGAHAAQAQALAHPAGAGLHAHVFHHCAHITVAQSGVFNVYLQKAVHIAVAGFYLRLVVQKGHAEGSGGLPRQTAHGQTVGPVGRDLKIHAHVVHTKRLHSVCAHGPFLVQHQNAVLDGVWKIVCSKAQLGQAAQHAARFHTAQLTPADLLAAGQLCHVQCGGHKVAHLQVVCACDDLYRRIAAHVHLAHYHMVGIRMGDDLQNFAHDDVFYAVGLALVGFHLAAAHGHAVGKFLGSAFKFGELFRPVHRHFHGLYTPLFRIV